MALRSENTKLPEEVVADIYRIWPHNKQHAAKQAACFIINVLPLDRDAHVNYSIAIGMLAATLQHCDPHIFIGAVEAEMNK